MGHVMTPYLGLAPGAAPDLGGTAPRGAAPAYTRRKPQSRSAGKSGSTTTPSTLVDRKSTRLKSSHLVNSYAVFCLKKKKTTQNRSCTAQGNCRRTRLYCSLYSR